jgi:hypothetical protein
VQFAFNKSEVPVIIKDLPKALDDYCPELFESKVFRAKA